MPEPEYIEECPEYTQLYDRFFANALIGVSARPGIKASRVAKIASRIATEAVYERLMENFPYFDQVIADKIYKVCSEKMDRMERHRANRKRMAESESIL